MNNKKDEPPQVAASGTPLVTGGGQFAQSIYSIWKYQFVQKWNDYMLKIRCEVLQKRTDLKQ